MTAPSQLHEIVGRLGGDFYNGGTRANVPGPGHSKRDRSLSLFHTPEGRILWHSFVAVDPAEVWTHLGLTAAAGREMSASEAFRARQDRIRAQRAEERRRLMFCQTVWRATVAAQGSPVETYLREVRAIRGPIPVTLRWAAAAPLGYDPGAPRLPAMVAPIQRPDGVVAGLHATYLMPDGAAKADLRNPRRMFGGSGGGAIRLSSAPTPGSSLGVAEGIETALSFRDPSGVSTWAAGSAALLARFVPPAGVSRLIVAADADDDGAGLAAARLLANRARAICNVTVTPSPTGKDWNTVAMEGRE